MPFNVQIEQIDVPSASLGKSISIAVNKIQEKHTLPIHIIDLRIIRGKRGAKKIGILVEYSAQDAVEANQFGDVRDDEHIKIAFEKKKDEIIAMVKSDYLSDYMRLSLMLALKTIQFAVGTGGLLR